MTTQRPVGSGAAGASSAPRGRYPPAWALERMRTHRPRSLSTTSRPWSSRVPRYSTASLAIRPYVRRITGPSARQVKACGLFAAKSSPSAKPLARTTSVARPSSQLPTKPFGPEVLQPPSIPPTPTKERQTAIGKQRDTKNRLMMGQRITLLFSLSFPPIQAVLLASPQVFRPLRAPTGLGLRRTGQNDQTGRPGSVVATGANGKPRPIKRRRERAEARSLE